MVFRQTRLIARSVCAAILIAALAALLVLGDNAVIQVGSRTVEEGGRLMTVSQAAFFYSSYGLAWYFAHAQAARVKRWRRNILRSGGVFATSWVGSLTLILAIEAMGFAAAAGYEVDRKAGYAAVIGILVLVRANQLPKSRPAWFNGVALPVFAARQDVWRKVHRLSALRLLAIGLLSIGLAAIRPAGVDPVKPIIALLVFELAIVTVHALWLGVRCRRNINQSGGENHDHAHLEAGRRGGKASSGNFPDPGAAARRD